MAIGPTTPITPQMLGLNPGNAQQAGIPAGNGQLETQIQQLGTALITLIQQLQPEAAGKKDKKTPTLGQTAASYALHSLQNSDTGYKYKPIKEDDNGWWEALGYNDVG